MQPALSLRERARGRRFYYIWSFFNSVSWAALAEGVVILMLLRLGASETWVGAVAALQYVTLPFMAVGYRTVHRLGITGTASLYWSIRSFSAIFMIAAPWMAGVHPSAGLWFMFLGALGFMLGRAGGIVAFTGIVTELTTPRSRGTVISNSSKISQSGSIIMTVLMAVFLGATAPFSRYQIFLTVGMLCGLGGSLALWKIPEAGVFRNSVPFDLLRELRWSVATRGRRWFLAMMVGIPVTQGVTYAFGVLVAKQGYGLSDQMVVLMVLMATFGGIAASYTYSFFLDQLGSRPLLVLTGFVDMAGVMLVVFMPPGFHLELLGLIFFINGYVMIAFFASIQHYFISLSDREHQLSQGIITRGIGGLAGGLALASAGWLLERLKLNAIGSPDELLHFRWFYGGLLVLLAVRSLIFFKLPPLQSTGIRSALNALFSPWDWRAIHAVRRALKVQREDEEARALSVMMRSGSVIFREDLERYLRSPSLFVRRRALEGLVLIEPGPELTRLLIKDLQTNLYTTAHRAAYLLGRWQTREALPQLRTAVNSADFRLSGAAIHALVELKDRPSLKLIEDRFRSSQNPYVLIQGARALSLWGDSHHYRMLLEKYHLDIPPQAKDEFSLAVTRLLGIYDLFYADLGMLHREPEQLEREWQDRFGTGDTEGLMAAMQTDRPRRSMLQAGLIQRRATFQDWFFDATDEFLKARPELVLPETAFLMTFLLLVHKGSHLRAG